MAKGDDFQERRKHKRFKVAEGAFAVSPPYYNKLGQIKDISKGGLACQYLGNNELPKSPLEVEIILTFDGRRRRGGICPLHCYQHARI